MQIEIYLSATGPAVTVTCSRQPTIDETEQIADAMREKRVPAGALVSGTFGREHDAGWTCDADDLLTAISDSEAESLDGDTE